MRMADLHEPDVLGTGRARVTAARASRLLTETDRTVSARPPAIHGSRPRAHGVLLSRDTGLVRATAGLSDLLYLQHVMGNRTVQGLLVARQQSTAEGPLSPPQVRDAIAFYRAQPARYTRDIIKEIQQAVGTDPTGSISAVDVQAVAKRQQALNVDAEPKLKIDGMAGPRTLPSIFKFGLSEDASVSDFAKKAKETFEAKDGKSEEEKAKSLVSDLINKRLAALNIPPVAVEVANDLGTRGAFSSGDWKLKLDRLQFQPGKFHDLRDTTATIYHEARHAEQDFRVGQLLARQGKNAEQITAITGLNADVAKKAVDAKGDITAMQALIAQGWFDSLHGAAGLARRRRNSEELRAAFTAREAACDAFKADPTPQNKAKLDLAKARFDRAVAEHDDLPHEFDAERLESKVATQFGDPEQHDDPCR